MPILAGTRCVDVDYRRIWVIGTTRLKGIYDVANVTRIQNSYILTHMSLYGTNFQPSNRITPDAILQAYQVPGGLAFYDMLGQQMALFPHRLPTSPSLLGLRRSGSGPGWNLRTP